MTGSPKDRTVLVIGRGSGLTTDEVTPAGRHDRHRRAG